MRTKYIFISLVLFTMLACKKNRTCECTYQQKITVTDTFGKVVSKTELEPTKSTREFKDVNKRTVNTLCASYTNSYETNNINGTISTSVNETVCNIKN